jgi:hypothetical protein
LIVTDPAQAEGAPSPIVSKAKAPVTAATAGPLSRRAINKAGHEASSPNLIVSPNPYFLRKFSRSLAVIVTSFIRKLTRAKSANRSG